MAEDLSPESQVLSENLLDSGLVLDLDRNTVRATLFDTVEGHGRFIVGAVINSTVNPPIDDVSLAVRSVIQKMEEETGRFLLSENRIQTPSDGFNGVDNLSLTGMPVRPTRLAIIPTGAHQLSRSLVSIARTTATVVRLLDSSIRTEDAVMSGTLLDAELRSFEPDIVVLLAGNKTQSEWPTAIGKLGDLMRENRAPQLIILASEQLQQHAIQQLGEDANLTGLDPNLYELTDVSGAVEIELHGVYEDRLKSADLGAASSAQQFVSRGRASDLVTRFVARRREQTITVADISDGASVHQASQTEGSMILRPDYDLRRNIKSILDLDLRRIQMDLPFGYSLEELRHWILNRGLRPEMIADLTRDQVIESAIASEIIRATFAEITSGTRSRIDMVVGGPAFAAWDDPMLGILSLINAFEPKPLTGLIDVVLDTDGIIGGAGAIGEMNPSLAADAVENDLMINSLSVIIVEGHGVSGDLAVRGNVRYDNGESHQFSVPSGNIYRVPAQVGDIASLTLVCESGFSIGGSSAGEEIEFGESRPIQNNHIGLLVDTRRSGTTDGEHASTRQNTVASWYSSLGIQY